MKISRLLRASLAGSASLIACAAVLSASPLPTTAAIQTRPESNAPAIGILKAGIEPVAAADQAGVPDGWLAVSASGPFEAYVRNRDLTKQLDVRPGSSLRLAPSDAAGVLEIFEKGDRAVITGLRGSWTRIRLDKTLTAYVRIAAPEAAAAPVSPVVADSASPLFTASPYPMRTGRAIPMTVGGSPVGPADTGAISRYFEGVFTSTHVLLLPSKPYDWELANSDGKRQVYLDLSRLVVTEQLEDYAHHAVEVFGRASLVGTGPDIVVQVESLRLK